MIFFESTENIKEFECKINMNQIRESVAKRTNLLRLKNVHKSELYPSLPTLDKCFLGSLCWLNLKAFCFSIAILSKSSYLLLLILVIFFTLLLFFSNLEISNTPPHQFHPLTGCSIGR